MTDSGPVTLERRAHPRVSHREPVDVLVEGQTVPIAAETVDVSVGGMRIASTDPVPVGRCRIELGSVGLVGEVLGQYIDIDSGRIVSRIKFVEVSPAAQDHLAEVTAVAAPRPATPAAAIAAVPTRRFYAGVIAAAILVLAVVAVVLVARGGSSDGDADSTSLASTSEEAEASPAESDASAPAGSDGDADVDEPATDPATGPSASTDEPAGDVAPEPATGPAPAPATADPAPAPAPPLVTRTESADNSVRVELAEDPSQTAVASTVGPSPGVDEVRIQLDVIPEQEGTTLPVVVTIENRGDTALEFADGLTTTITVTGEDGDTQDVVLRAADVTTLAPGARHELAGSIDFGGYGDFEVTATTPVGERA